MYIDLNPVRAGIVSRPEDYRWNSIGRHVRTGNKDGFLSLDFGMAEFGVGDTGERLRRYRRFLYLPFRERRSTNRREAVLGGPWAE